MSLSHEQVQDLLPHRYPFLFVDKVTELESGHRVEGTFRIKTDHPFVNRVGVVSVFPATLVVEALQHFVFAMTREIRSLGNGPKDFSFALTSVHSHTRCTRRKSCF